MEKYSGVFHLSKVKLFRQRSLVITSTCGKKRTHVHIEKWKLPKKKVHDIASLRELLTEVKPIVNNCVSLMVVRPFADELKAERFKFPLTYKQLYDEIMAEHATYDELVEYGWKLQFNLKRSNITLIEETTRLQSKCADWFTYRAGRITASNVRAVRNFFQLFEIIPELILITLSLNNVTQVCGVRSYDSNVSLLEKLCYPESYTFTSKYTTYGCNHEKIALQNYYEIMKDQHVEFIVNPSGLVIYKKLPFLAASPDAVVHCTCCGAGVLEIKWPYCLKAADATISDLVYLDDQDGQNRLKKEHQYYYQVQTQLMCTELPYADFFVWSSKDFHMERMNDCFDIIRNKCTSFFFNSIVSELIGKWFTRNRNSAK